MGLFDKKYCDICGEKIGLLGNRKLEDGNLCKNCAKKLSPWFDERRHSTVEQIRRQLEYREANREKAAAFHASRSFGDSSVKFYADETAGRFCVTSAKDFAAQNPDILEVSQLVGCSLDIREDQDELMREDADGKKVSYVPPQYEYSYDFYATIKVAHPYFDEMRFLLNSGTVRTGQRNMTAAPAGAWRVNNPGSNLRTRAGVDAYYKYIDMGNELSAFISSWQSAQKEAEAAQETGQAAGAFGGQGGMAAPGTAQASGQAAGAFAGQTAGAFGGQAAGAFGGQAAGAPSAQPADPGVWTCACGGRNTGNFCEYCGLPRPHAADR